MIPASTNMKNTEWFISILQDWANRSKDIQGRFNFGGNDEINSLMETFPYMYAEPGDITLINNGDGKSGYGTMEISFNITIADKLKSGKDNEIQTVSDSQEMMMGVIAEFSTHPYYNFNQIKVINDPVITTRFEQDDAIVSKVSTDITFSLPFKYQYCNQPVDGIPFYPSITSDVFTSATQSICTLIEGCPVIITIENTLVDLQEQIDNIIVGGGATGSTGPQGFQGPAGGGTGSGSQGPQGSNGIDGSTGPQGSDGPQGPQGNTGSNGLDGSTGPQGSDGPQGFQGPAGGGGTGSGSQGPQGPTGIQGIQGPTGPNSIGGVGITIDGLGGVISTGQKGYVYVPYNGTITGWSILSDQSGSCVVDVWKDTFVNFPPVVGDSIAGTEKPTLATQSSNRDLSLSTWTTSVSSGDVIGFNVDSATGVTRVNVLINIIKS